MAYVRPVPGLGVVVEAMSAQSRAALGLPVDSVRRWLLTMATRLGRQREAGLGEGSGARRKGRQLLQKPHVRAAIADLKAAVLNRADQRTEDDARAAALAREAELDRLARLELTALLDREEAMREQRILMRMHHEFMGRRKAPRRLARRRTIAARACLPPVPGRARTP